MNKQEIIKKIIEMLNDMEDMKTLNLLYYYVSSGYNEEKAGVDNE